jgi:hypothetical protein
MFTSPDALRIIDIWKLPRFKFKTSVRDGVEMIPVELVCYGMLPEGEYVRDPGEYLVDVLYGAGGQLIAQNVKAELLDPNK